MLRFAQPARVVLRSHAVRETMRSVMCRADDCLQSL
jgi:hypothetical protein